jgi:AcrR family transcriptional regulator
MSGDCVATAFGYNGLLCLNEQSENPRGMEDRKDPQSDLETRLREIESEIKSFREALDHHRRVVAEIQSGLAGIRTDLSSLGRLKAIAGKTPPPFRKQLRTALSEVYVHTARLFLRANVEDLFDRGYYCSLVPGLMEFFLGMKKYHHGNLRATLIDTGLEVIAEKGVRALTLREIGARAGVSRTAAYRHFNNKADLLFAISEAGFAEFVETLENAKAVALPNFTARMQAMGQAYVNFARRHPAYYEVMFQFGSQDIRRGEYAARGFAVLEETIREGQASHEVEPGDSNRIAGLMWSVVHGVASLGLEALGSDFTHFCIDRSLKGIQLRP